MPHRWCRPGETTEKRIGAGGIWVSINLQTYSFQPKNSFICQINFEFSHFFSLLPKLSRDLNHLVETSLNWEHPGSVTLELLKSPCGASCWSYFLSPSAGNIEIGLLVQTKGLIALSPVIFWCVTSESIFLDNKNNTGYLKTEHLASVKNEFRSPEEHLLESPRLCWIISFFLITRYKYI